jgi:hypothetical protein
MLGGFLTIVGLGGATGRRVVLWASAGTAKTIIAATAKIDLIAPWLPEESLAYPPILATAI